MNTELLKQYEVSFRVQRFFNQDFKKMDTVNDMLTVYITDHNTLMRANNLLEDIIAVLNGKYPLGGGQTQSLYLANVTATETKIYFDLEKWEEDNNIKPDYVLPTSDFKVIVEVWRDFLKKNEKKSFFRKLKF